MDALGLYGLKGTGSYDQVSGHFFYRVGDMGKVIPDWKYLEPIDKERELYNLQVLDAQVETQEKAKFEAELQAMNPHLPPVYQVRDYRDSLSKSQQETLRTSNLNLYEKPAPETRRITEPDGTLMGRFTGYSPPLKTEFELWKEAREGYATGGMSLDQVLRHVRLDDGDLYGRVVEEELYGVHKYWFSWRRWSIWRRLVRWYHRRNLGRHWDGEDYVGPARRQRSRAAR